MKRSEAVPNKYEPNDKSSEYSESVDWLLTETEFDNLSEFYSMFCHNEMSDNVTSMCEQRLQVFAEQKVMIMTNAKEWTASIIDIKARGGHPTLGAMEVDCRSNILEVCRKHNGTLDLLRQYMVDSFGAPDRQYILDKCVEVHISEDLFETLLANDNLVANSSGNRKRCRTKRMKK